MKSRIAVNTLAAYGQSVLSIGLGLFSVRWVLQGLGGADFGLFGVVGGLIVFVTLLNGLMSGSVARFYAYAIGEGESLSPEASRENVMRWFNVAVLIHIVLPILLVLVGYPLGVWAIGHWLSIPPDRLGTAVWVFRISLVSAFVNMVAAPYLAMFVARQRIAELSVWNMGTSAVNFLIAFWILRAPGDRLLWYAGLSVILPCLILVLQIRRAQRCFDACRLRWAYACDAGRLRRIFAYACWEFLGWSGALVRDQGSVLITNRHFGLDVNAAYGIAAKVVTQTSALANAIQNAMHPAITTAIGAKNHEEARTLAYRCCAWSTLLVLLFAIPLAIEIRTVLRLWLVEPPPYTAELCVCVLAAAVCVKSAWGLHLAVLAHGKIGCYQTVLGLTAASGAGLMLALIAGGAGPLSGGLMLCAVSAVMAIERVVFAHLLLGFSIRRWLGTVALPLGAISVLTFLPTHFLAGQFAPSLLRLVLTTVVSTILMAFMVLLCKICQLPKSLPL